MAILLPRARLDLFAKEWQLLDLSDEQKAKFQTLLDQSKLEQRLQGRYHTHIISLNSTAILPGDSLHERVKPAAGKSFDIVIVVSKHAALLSGLLLPSSLFSRAHCFSVGKASKAFLPDVELQHAEKESAYGLLTLPELKMLAGKSVLIIKGEQGLDDLELECKQRGAEVSVLDLYQRQANQYLEQALSEISLNDIEFIYGVSVFALEHLLQLASQTQKQILVSMPVKVMSERIAKAALNFGFAHTMVESL